MYMTVVQSRPIMVSIDNCGMEEGQQLDHVWKSTLYSNFGYKHVLWYRVIESARGVCDKYQVRFGLCQTEP